MLTLGIRYLTGTVAASDVADRDAVEWPPHPGRVFMALAAAYFQTGDDPAERTALEWLETLPAPQVTAGEHQTRTAVTHFVPVNDRDGIKGPPVASAPGAVRVRQPRPFARAWLADDTVFFHWPDTDPGLCLPALQALAGKVTRIGHSMSLVQCWFSDAAPTQAANWLPCQDRSEIQLRITSAGVLRELERRFDRKRVARYFDRFTELSTRIYDFDQRAETAPTKAEKKAAKADAAIARQEFEKEFGRKWNLGAAPDTPPPRLRPALSLAQGYARRVESVTPSAAGTVFDPRLIVLALERIDAPFRFLDVVATLQVTSRLREALLSQMGRDCGGPAPEVLSGHVAGGPSQTPHLALLPLPFVGHEHAHGGLLGLALALPAAASAADRNRLLRALADIGKEGLKLGPLGHWRLQPPDGNSPASLRGRIWTAAPGGALAWSTVTPYVYDRHAKAKDKAAYHAELAEAVHTAWTRVRTGGAPAELIEVVVSPVSRHLGAPAAHEFPRLRRKDGSQCRHSHLILRFDRPVVGPLMLGAGRYLGYGFCRPCGDT